MDLLHRRLAELDTTFGSTDCAAAVRAGLPLDEGAAVTNPAAVQDPEFFAVLERIRE